MSSLLRWQSPIILLLLFSLLAADALAAEQTPRQAAARRILDERPDDPPGIPAGAVPGSPPAQSIQFGNYTHVQVNVAPTGADIVNDAGNEPSIAVDPTNPNNMAIGWRQFDTITSNFRQAGVAWSWNGGRHWQSPGPLEPGIFRSDPVLDFDAAGNFYYNSLKVVGSVFDCWVFKSTTGGNGWSPAVFAYGGDKCWMAVDRSGGASDGHVYNVWSIFGNQYTPRQFNRSTDGGATYGVPEAITFSPIWGTLDVGPNGNVYVAGVDPGDASNILVARSLNAQNPAATPVFDAVVSVNLGGSVVFSAGGSPNPGGLLGQIQIVADQTTSGPTVGNLYVLATVDPPGADPLDIRFATGSDNGLTWGPSQRINDDPTDSGAWQWFGTMAIAPNGRLDIVWNDTRNTGLANESQLYRTSSTDGGATWLPNEQISATFDSYAGWPNQNKLGDYYDMISDDVGAHLAWAATFSGGQDVYYTRIGDYDCNTNGIADAIDISLGTSVDNDGDGIPDECDELTTGVPSQPGIAGYRLHQNHPNPFNPTTSVRFDVPAPGANVTVRVYDTAGRLIKTLIDGFRSEGEKTVSWDGRDDSGRRVASGVYFYRLQAPGFTESRKLILMK